MEVTNPMKNRMLLTSLLLVGLLAPMAGADEANGSVRAGTVPAAGNQSAQMELPGGIRASVEAQSNFEWLGTKDQVCQFRLQQGACRVSVPAGTSAKVSASPFEVLASDAELALSLKGQQCQLQVLRGEAVVAGPSGELRRLTVGQTVAGRAVNSNLPQPQVAQPSTPPVVQEPSAPLPQASSAPGIEQTIISALPSVLPMILNQGQNNGGFPIGLPQGSGLPGLNLPSIIGNLPGLIR